MTECDIKRKLFYFRSFSFHILVMEKKLREKLRENHQRHIVVLAVKQVSLIGCAPTCLKVTLFRILLIVNHHFIT